MNNSKKKLDYINEMRMKKKLYKMQEKSMMNGSIQLLDSLVFFTRNIHDIKHGS
mgnify:CR=1 FL=1